MVLPAVEKTPNAPPLPVLEGNAEQPPAEPNRPWHIQVVVGLLSSVGYLTAGMALLGGLIIVMESFGLLTAERHGRRVGTHPPGAWLPAAFIWTVLTTLITYGVIVWIKRIWRIPGKEPSDEED